MRRHLAWFVLALALSACSSQDRTRLAVTVYSDLSIPLEIDALRVEVQGPSGAPQQVEYALAAQATEGKVTLPVQTILVPQGKKDDTFTVTASGIKDRSAVITRTARLSFIPGDARELIIFLNRDCYQRTCAADKTCMAGACVPNTVNTSGLPVYTTNKAGSAQSPDASVSLTDSSSGDTTLIDGGQDLGGKSFPDARPQTDTTPDLHRDETGSSTPDVQATADADLDTSSNPGSDAPLPATDTTPVRLLDSGPVISGPDTATPFPDSKPPVDTAPTVDTASPTDTPQLLPDAALPDTPLASPDTPADAPCPVVCDLGAKRCGTTGLQTCGTLTNGCIGWGAEQSCGTRQSCQGSAPAAECRCTGSGSNNCPLAGNTAGTFCDGQQTLQTCLQDGDGCFYLGAPLTCPAGKPCAVENGSASCSCGAATAPCTNRAGTFCNADQSQVFSCAYDSGTGCLVTTPGATCPTGKPCEQTGPEAAECKCPIVAACDTASEMNRSYCSSNTVITCSPDANSCQQASSVDCHTNQTCQASGTTASCVCINAHCLNPSGGTFDQQACDGEGRVLTCGTVDACPAITSTVTCADGTVCRPSGENARCLNASGAYTEFTNTGLRSSTVLLGQPITAVATGTLAKIGLIVKALPTTGPVSVKMGVYSATDGGLVAAVEGPIAVGRNELAPATTVSLASGSVYWVFAVFSVDSVTVSQSATAASRRSQTFAYGNALPTSMNASTPGTGVQTNHYLLIAP